MAWFYNNYSGALIEESAPAPEFFVLEGELHLGNGWHEYGTEAEVNAAVAANHWPAPTTSSSQQVSNAAGSAAHKAASAASSAIGDGFKLTFGNTTGLLGRILKAGFGIVLIIAGFLKLTGAGKTLEQVIPVVGGAAGKVLRA